MLLQKEEHHQEIQQLQVVASLRGKRCPSVLWLEMETNAMEIDMEISKKNSKWKFCLNQVFAFYVSS